jgi:DNA polymerase III subunit gamma/tau
MEAFIVSARKYRPQEFDSVVGQQHITRTLFNAVEKNQLGQALLFTGPRGVGKTTCARILAKMINRTSLEDQTDYSLNIFELDAASNNSVDDIRNLVDQVRFAPQVGSFKVYIIDEVHMLSQAAFNAFLKTLEEPPKHAVFILATTEKHKILPTILSRCQIYDFRRITVPDIVVQLKEIAAKENVQYEETALHLVAQKADGAMRDALSIFDRLVSFSEGNVTYAAAAELLSVLDFSYYFRLTDYILNNQGAEVIQTVHEILAKGFDMHLMVNGLANHLRNLWMCLDPRTIDLLDVSDDLKQRYLQQSAACSPNWLVFALKQLMDVDMQYKNSQQQQLLVEVSLLRLALPASDEKKNDQPEVVPSKNTQNSTTVSSALNSNPAKPSIASENQSTASTSIIPEQAIAEKAKTETPPAALETNISPASPVVTEPTSTPQPVRTAARRSGFSIAQSMQAEKEKNENTDEDTSLIAEKTEGFSLNEEHLVQYYRIFVETIKERDQTLIASTLQSLTPLKKGDYTIVIQLHSETQKTLIGECQTELMSFLREKLGHQAIELEINILAEEAENTVKSPNEKLEIILQNHPESQLLIDELGLKLDY